MARSVSWTVTVFGAEILFRSIVRDLVRCRRSLRCQLGSGSIALLGRLL